MATHTPHILPFIVLAIIFFRLTVSIFYFFLCISHLPFHFTTLHLFQFELHFSIISLQLILWCAAFSMFFFFLFSASDFFTISFSIFSKAAATTRTPRTPSQREEKITRKTLFRYFILQKKNSFDLYCVVLYSMNIE